MEHNIDNMDFDNIHILEENRMEMLDPRSLSTITTRSSMPKCPKSPNHGMFQFDIDV